MLPACGRADKRPQEVLQNRVTLQLAGKAPQVRRKRGGELAGLRLGGYSEPFLANWSWVPFTGVEAVQDS